MRRWHKNSGLVVISIVAVTSLWAYFGSMKGGISGASPRILAQNPDVEICGVRLGDNQDQVLRVLGKPQYSKREHFSWPNEIDVVFSGGRANAISGKSMILDNIHFAENITEEEIMRYLGQPARIFSRESLPDELTYKFKSYELFVSIYKRRVVLSHTRIVGTFRIRQIGSAGGAVDLPDR